MTYKNEKNETTFDEKDRLIERLRNELKEKVNEIERLKNAPRTSDFPTRLTRKDEAKPNGKVLCDRTDCNECEYIQNPLRHFHENLSSLMDVFKHDANKINEIKIAMNDENDCRRFSVDLPENYPIPDSVPPGILHFEGCHLCYCFWNDSSRPNIVLHSCVQDKITKGKTRTPKRGKK